MAVRNVKGRPITSSASSIWRKAIRHTPDCGVGRNLSKITAKRELMSVKTKLEFGQTSGSQTANTSTLRIQQELAFDLDERYVPHREYELRHIRQTAVTTLILSVAVRRVADSQTGRNIGQGHASNTRTLRLTAIKKTHV